jgi:hypothetical protein
MPVSRSVAWLRPLLAFVALVIITGAFFVLPASLTSGLLAGVVVVAVGIGAWQTWLHRDTINLPSREELVQRWQNIAPTARIASIVAGAGLLLWASYQFLPNQTLTAAEVGIGMFIVGAVFFGAAFVGESLLVVQGTAQARTDTLEKPVQWRVVLFGIIAILIVVQAHFLLVSGRYSLLNYHLQFWVLVYGWVLVVAGFIGASRPRLKLPSLPRLTRHRLLFLGVMAVAVYVRLTLLTTGVHRWIDEINFLEAINELKVHQPSILMPFGNITAFSYFFPYLQWWWYSLFAPSIESVRMPAVIFGVAQVAALYWMMTVVANRRVALLTAFLFATFPPAIHFARMGINNVADPLFGILALGFMVRAIHEGRRSDFVLAGFMLGLSHYFYEGGRLFYSLFAACWIVWVFITARKSKRVGRVWVYGVVTFLLTVLPMYLAWTFNDKPLFPRFNSVGRTAFSISQTLQDSNDDLRALWEQVRNPLLSFVHSPDTGAFYKNDTGYLLPYLVPFFLLGLAYCAWRWRTLGGGMFFWSCIAVAFANGFITNAVDAPRYNVIFPILCAVTALGVELIWSWMERGLPRQRLRDVVVLVCVLAMGFLQAHYYLSYHMPLYYYRQFYTEFDLGNSERTLDHEDMLFRAVQLQSPVDIFAFADGFLNPRAFAITSEYFDRGRADGYAFYWEYSDGMVKFLKQMEMTDVPRAFFIEQDADDVLAYLQQEYTLYGPYYSDPSWNIPHERQMELWVTDMAVLPVK